jgi:poly(hydroxyalkanoate) granule-associated protein
MVRKSVRKAKSGRGTNAQERSLGILHEVWLAGLGAVVRAQRGAPRLLEELITEGARFQQDQRGAAEKTLQRLVGDARSRVQAGIGQMRGQAGDALENLEKVFQTRVHRALGQLGVPTTQELSMLSDRVDSLSASVDRLASKPPPGAGRYAGRKAGTRGAAMHRAETATVP